MSRQDKDKRKIHAVKVDRRREKAVAPRRAGWSESVVPPSQEAIRAAIESQICPWCGKGPFAMLPVHTNKAHAIDKYELRDLAGLTTHEPMISEEARQRMRDYAASLSAEDRHERSVRGAAALKGRKKPSRRWTKAGMHKSPLKSHCHRGHEFTPENTRINADGTRTCRSCRNEDRRSTFAKERARQIAEHGKCSSVSKSGHGCALPLGHEGKHASGKAGPKWADERPCSTEGCTDRADSLGMCRKHYKRARRANP